MRRLLRTFAATAGVLALAVSTALATVFNPQVIGCRSYAPAGVFASGVGIPIECDFVTASQPDSATMWKTYVINWECISNPDGSSPFSFATMDTCNPSTEYRSLTTAAFTAPGTYRIRVGAAAPPDTVSHDLFYGDTLTIRVGPPNVVRDLLPADFEYLGAFRTGHAAGDTAGAAPGGMADTFDGAPANMCYTRSGDNTADGYPGLLWCMGHTQEGQGGSPGGWDSEGGVLGHHMGGKVCALKIPVPSLSRNLDSLTIATVKYPMRHVAWPYFNMAPTGGQMHCDGLWVDALTATGDTTAATTIYTYPWDYYNNTAGNSDAPVWAGYTIADSTYHGLWHWGDYTGSDHRASTFSHKYASGAFLIPDDWVNSVLGIPGHKFLAGTNGLREGGFSSDCYFENPHPNDAGRIYTGNGPSLGIIKIPAVYPDSADTINLNTLLMYNYGVPVPPQQWNPAPGDTLNDMDAYRQGAWISTNYARGLIYVCRKCMYGSHYQVPGSCNDGGMCHEGNRGFKCGHDWDTPPPSGTPYSYRIYCYTIGSIEAVAHGNMRPDQPAPLWYIDLGQYFFPYSCHPEVQTCFTCSGGMGGMAWDPYDNLLYVTQTNVDDTADGGGRYEPGSVIHVFRVGARP